MTRLMTVARALIVNPHIGISEKESYFNCHFLNARNEVNEIERTLDIEIERVKEKSEAGRYYTRYLLGSAEQIHKVAELYNAKLKYQQQHNKKYLELVPITGNEIQHAINLLGAKK
ncbi:hypothetical protein SAMN05660772_02860 [Pasteurella testudinis DSM 23072]|uniref:Uncharacterized protein n=1 Tax=Pasteurella testudinis DSM 23072 TaxID=1122938 RepID=A0A1W1V5Q9_9PAST|nr:hypothetical protein [Pasteurella testudinis]SMB88739.1 hypothetical protein SAMN05660772_02860 [Pasteurella testudinis DSM 23072]SUB51563.1 Uncharacterised protein [Pasteurella testudinis]